MLSIMTRMNVCWTLYHTILNSTTLRKKTFENVLGKGENAGKLHFLHFQKCLLPFQKQISMSYFTFILSSASALILDWAKILLLVKS